MVEIGPGLVATIATIILGLTATVAYVVKAREKLHAVRVLVDDIDDALADNVLSKEEVERITDDLHEILGDSGATTAGQ